MKFTKSASVEELQVVSRFESLRKILTTEQYADHLKRPLAYWALPSDRRLPLAFLGRTLDDLLKLPFAELSGTPGIGQKKICSFVKLLARAANTDPSELPLENVILPIEEELNGGGLDSGDGFDPATVSEAVWAQWRASISKHELGEEKLGRFAPTLRHMTRVIWNTPMGAYTHFSLAEVRALKTHGEKRVRAILEVFHSVHALVADMGTQEHLVVRVVPRLIDRAEQWIGQALQSPGLPSRKELFENLIALLLEQVRNDATQQIASLAEDRLGLKGSISSVRQVARSTGLTRARVYQLLNDVNDIMAVRWPHGRHQMYELRDKLLSEYKRSLPPAAPPPDAAVAGDAAPDDDMPDASPHASEPAELQQFLAAIELFYPGSRRGASGPLENMLEEDEEHVEEARETMVEEEELVEAK